MIRRILEDTRPFVRNRVAREIDDIDLADLSHTMDELRELIKQSPIRVAQRLLRTFGDSAEREVIVLFPHGEDKNRLIDALKMQRRRYSDRQWSRWGVDRTY